MLPTFEYVVKSANRAKIHKTSSIGFVNPPALPLVGQAGSFVFSVVSVFSDLLLLAVLPQSFVVDVQMRGHLDHLTGYLGEPASVEFVCIDRPPEIGRMLFSGNGLVLLFARCLNPHGPEETVIPATRGLIPGPAMGSFSPESLFTSAS